MPRTHRALGAATALAVLGSCSYPSHDDIQACAAIAVAGVTVTLTDSLTGQGTGFTGVWGKEVDGPTYTDSTSTVFTDPTTGAMKVNLGYNHAGTVTVTVHANGYQNWTKSGVVVTRGECLVANVPLTAKLVH